MKQNMTLTQQVLFYSETIFILNYQTQQLNDQT